MLESRVLESGMLESGMLDAGRVAGRDTGQIIPNRIKKSQSHLSTKKVICKKKGQPKGTLPRVNQ